MNQKTELKLNIGVILVGQVLLLIVNYLTKQAILQQLNAEYMGLQTVCTNFSDLLTMSFSATGIVMLFWLYKPLENHDEAELASVFIHFRKIFRILTGVSVIAGILLSLLTLISVDIDLSVGMILFYYWLFLGGVLCVNTFQYNYYFLMADQKRYIASGICSAIDVFALAAELLALYLTKNYALFLIVIVIKNLVQMGLIAIYRKRHYSFLDRVIANELDFAGRKRIRKNILDMVISKVGSLLLYNTDSILISALVSTAVSGYYSCYYFIAYGLQFTMVTVFDTLIPKIGQLSLQKSKNSQYQTYVLVSLFNIACTAICIAGFYNLAKDFIILWVGESALLDDKLFLLISLNLYISMCRYTSSTFRQAEGLFKRISWVILFRGLFNVVLSTVLGIFYGLFGIVIATSISDALTVFWYEPYLVHRFYKKKIGFEFFYQIFGATAVVSSTYLGHLVIGFLPEISWSFFLWKGIAVVSVAALWLGILAGLLCLVYLPNKKRILDWLDSHNTEEVFSEDLPVQDDPDVKISFVLPVYNGEKVVSHAISSILDEKDIALELILIDDGSTDKTLNIALDYSRKDSRLKLIHTENQGQGIARNLGIQAASGKYVAFVDADDSVLWDGMRRLVDMVKKQRWDVVCGNYYTLVNDHRYVGLEDVSSGQVLRDKTKDTLYQNFKTASVFGYCWNKLYRTEFLRDNNLYFDDIRKVFMEDTLFNLKIFSKNPLYYYCDTPVYEYFVLNQSSSRQPEPEIVEKYTDMLNCYGDYLTANNCVAENADLLIPLAMRVFCWSMIRNIPFEKDMYAKNVRMRINRFMNGSCFKTSVSNLKNIRTLDLLPSALHQVMFKVCFFLLNRGLRGLTALIFILGYPAFKHYVERYIKE